MGKKKEEEIHFCYLLLLERTGASWNSGCRIHTHDNLTGGDDDDSIKSVWGILCHTRVYSVRRSVITDLFFVNIL